MHTASWMDITIFYLANYVAHLGTVRVEPGTKVLNAVAKYGFCFFFPLIGLRTAIDCILHCAIFAPKRLQKAVRKGALCMVVRSEKPLGIGTRKNHGINIPEGFSLPEYHYFVIVPRNASIGPPPSGHFKHDIKYRWDWFKILLSILQLIYSIYTLYKVSEHQIARFGYAAFGLTIAPYAIMGFLNLVANLITPQFDEVSLVYSNSLLEALKYAAEPYTKLSTHELALVGTLIERDLQEMEAESDTASMLAPQYSRAPHPLKQRFFQVFKLHPDNEKFVEFSYSSKMRYWFFTILSLGVVVGVFALVYLISKARPGQSTIGERIWIVGWLFCGSVSPFVMLFSLYIYQFFSVVSKYVKAQRMHTIVAVFVFLFCAVIVAAAGAFTIGGLVAVAQMMLTLGHVLLLIR